MKLVAAVVTAASLGWVGYHTADYWMMVGSWGAALGASFYILDCMVRGPA